MSTRAAGHPGTDEWNGVMTTARNNATNGTPYELPKWNHRDLVSLCRMHVMGYDRERKFWRDHAWKRYCKERYVKCSAWLLTHT